jgi:parallel beta-helix repeat protein
MKRIVNLFLVGLFLFGGLSFGSMASPMYNGETLYVSHAFNESTPGWGVTYFNTIQDAVDHSSEGDTVYVYNGTYVENVVVDVSITLEGEDKEITTIDGNRSGDVVEISADTVVVTEFTIKNGRGSGFFGGGGIKLVNTSHCMIHHTNIVENDLFGICVTSDNKSSYTTIVDNLLSENGNPLYGGFNIWLYKSPFNTIANNTITNGNGYGIGLCYWSTDTVVNGNTITDNKYDGIKGRFVYNNEVYENVFKNNMCGIGWYNISEGNHVYSNLFEANEYYGIYFRDVSSFNLIECNTFLDNLERDAYFYLKNIISLNKWKQNYWSASRFLPKLVIGGIPLGPEFTLPWVNVDWRPAREPYDISS